MVNPQKTALLCATFLLVLGLSISAKDIGNEPSNNERSTKIDALLALLADAKVPGAQIVYSKKGKQEIYNLGIINAESNEPVTSATVFQAASLTKVVAAYAILRLVDRGEFDLDRPLIEYVEYERIKDDPNAKLITGRMVLSHTSGFPNWAISPSDPRLDETPLKTNFKPGTEWSYSGEGFYFLQKALEANTEKNIEMIIYDEVLKPLKMESTFLTGLKRLVNVQAYGHDAEGNTGNRRAFPQANIAYTLLTTAEDYDKFIQQALLKGKGLKKESRKLLFSVQGTADRKDKPSKADPYIDWGLGIGLRNNEKGKAIWHWGDNGVFKCFFIAFPKQNESLVIMTNSSNSTDVYEDVLKLFFGEQSFYSVQWVRDGM